MFNVRTPYRVAAMIALFAIAVLIQLPNHDPVPAAGPPEIALPRFRAMTAGFGTMTALGQNQGPNGGNPSDLGAPVFSYATTTGAGAMTMQAAAGAGVSNYVYQALCVNTSATATTALLKGGSTTYAPIPCAAAGANALVVFSPPIKVAANTAVTLTAQT